jgi:tRNA splicing ligase
VVIQENFEEELEEKIIENKFEKPEKIAEKFTINIPKIAKKEDLHDLKSFLENEKK